MSSTSGRGKGCLALFFLVFLGMGVLFTYFLLRQVYETALTYTWPGTECEILASRGFVDEKAADTVAPFVFEVRYRYAWQGETYFSGREPARMRTSWHWADIRRLVKNYRAGGKAKCYVNSRSPMESTLERESLWFACFVLIPLVFVAIGAGGIYFTWFWRGEITPKKLPRIPYGWGVVVFFLFLLLLGGGLFAGFFLAPARQVIESPSWRQTACRVEFSRVGRHVGEDSTTFSIDVLYSHREDGVEYRSSRYGLFDFSSSGFTEKSEIVERLPKGAAVACYVSPRNPEEAVLDRSFPYGILFGLIPLVVGLVGLFGLFKAVPRALRGPAAAVPSGIPPEVPGPVVLRPAATGCGRLLGCGLFTAVWNGFIAVFAWEVVSEWRRGAKPWFETVFLLPFLAVGAAGAVSLPYYFLALFSPKPRLTLTPGAVRLGGSGMLQWEIGGWASAIRRLHIWLEGRDEAPDKSADSATAQKETFAKLELLDLPEPMGMSGGMVSFTLPREARPSSEGDGKKTVWVVRVSGEIRWWPDIDEEFPIRVLPAE